MRKYLSIIAILFFYSCKTELKPDRFSQNFRDQFVCLCMVEALDSLLNETKVRTALTSSSPEAFALYNKTIRKIVPKVIGMIYKDSLEKVGHVGENAQGYDIYRICLAYSRSKEMDSIILEQKKWWDTIPNVDQYISNNFPY